jgi:hypothetical protein
MFYHLFSLDYYGRDVGAAVNISEGVLRVGKIQFVFAGVVEPILAP